jgi:anaerobic magnesium-protoporphyrin IX monomethyl ester cyclase
MSRILFVYPNKEGYPIVPLGISVLSGIMKHHGHIADLFDITFIITERYDHKAREKTGVVKKVDVEKYWGAGDKINIDEEFRNKIINFQPDIIAFTVVENNYFMAKRLLQIAKETSSALTIVGGLFPTIMPNLFINSSDVDLVCVGEGEYAMIELAAKLDLAEEISGIPNLVVKHNGDILHNKLSVYYNWEPPVFQDWKIFDERHLLKPFMGEMHRTGFFELSRGCPYKCGYCTNRLCQEIFKSLGRYNREKPMEYAIKEIEHLKGKYNLELIFFNDENFLTMRNERLADFCKKFSSRVSLPFFIMTRADSLLDETKIKMLKEAGCVTIGIGVECGSEDIRRKLLNKNITNEVYEKAFANCHKYDIRTTANVMIGLPFETEENIIESANFCRKLQAKSLSLAIFAPYHGTLLRDICCEEGYIENIISEDIAIINRSILNMPQLSKGKIEELYLKFNDLVYG